MANEFIPKFDINPYTLRALAQIAQNYNNYNIGTGGDIILGDYRNNPQALSDLARTIYSYKQQGLIPREDRGRRPMDYSQYLNMYGDY